MAAAIESVPRELEDVARTLGSRPFGTFRKIILPLTKYSIFSGAIIVLTRSLNETGATIAVVHNLQTTPVLLVNWINSNYSSSVVGLGIFFLILISFVFLLAIRLALRRSTLVA